MNFLPHLLCYFAFSLLLTLSSAVASPLLRPLTPDQGLSQGSIRDLLLDKEGFLWLATDGGVNRYDSTSVTHITAQGYQLKALSFSSLLQDSSGKIWASSHHAGIYRFNQDKALFELFMPMPTEPNSELPVPHNIAAVLEYDTNTLLFVMDDALYRLPLDTAVPERIFSLSEQGIENGWLRTAAVVNGHIFIAAFNGLYHFDTASKEATRLPHLTASMSTSEKSKIEDQQHVKQLKFKHNRLWIGTVEGLYSIGLADIEAYLEHDVTYTPLQHIARQNIWQLLWQNEQALVATEQGLFSLSIADKSLTNVIRFTDSDLDLFDNNIIDFVADKYGGYWLGSRDDGAFYWHPRGNAFSNITRSYAVASGLSNEKVFSLAVQESNTLWIGTNNGLNQVDLTTNNVQQYLVNPDTKAIFHGGTIYQIYPDAPGKLWLLSALGLRYFDYITNTLTMPPANDDKAARILAEQTSFIYRTDEQFYLYANNAFFIYTPKKADLTALPELDGVFSASLFGGFIGEVSANGQLLLSAADQLWLYDTERKQARMFYQHPQFKPELNRQADGLVIDRNGVLWIGCYGLGLFAFDRESLTLQHHFDSSNALLSDDAYALQTDAEGNIWFSSHIGISRLNPDTLQIEHFSKADGLPTYEYNGTASAKLPDGRLAFGSMRGVTLVTPSDLTTEHERPTAMITGISVQAGELSALNGNLNERHITLSYQDLGITLNFSSMNFRDAHKMQYRFWLEGQRELQYPIQTSSKVAFPQLESGDYVFNVVSISPTNGLESTPARLFLHVIPSPWLSNWALAAYFLLAMFAAFRFYQYRRRQHDEITAAHEKVQQSALRMMQALASVNSGAWEWNASTDQLFAKRIYNMLGYSEQLNPLSLQQHISLIHPDDVQNFNNQWQRFLQQPTSGFDCTYRLQHKDGNWLWFRDIGKATDMVHVDNVTKVIGTYSNITETRANQEKARLFGEAFQQTRDWVVILDSHQRVIAANQSFTTAFGNIEQYLDQPRVHHLGISLKRRRFYTKLLRELQSGEHWQGEEQVITPDGRERPTLINISAIGEQQQQTFFVLVFTDITAQKMAEDELRYLANYDALTGLPNRALLMDRIYHGIDQAKRDKRSLALCFIDLDRFKQINDSLGHDVGDLLLKEVARRLTEALRDSDTVARLGGDEFVVLLEGYKNEDNISHVARKMLTVVGEPMQLATHTVGVSPSIGIAVYPDDAINATELLKHADVAMYHAKEAGRNNFQFFTEEMNEKAHMRLAKETRLRNALHNDEFINYYQPIINSQTRQVVGAEVLLRWQSAEGMVSPAEFIPLAEELRLIINMTQQILERALSALKQWHNDGHQIYLSVNLSTQHLEQPALAEQTRALLKKYELPASCLRFEVTESALMRDHQSAIDTMLALSKLGVQLALDDFGTGYSSLKYLKELPIDGIKIDRSFVKDIGIDNSDETIIEAMLSMAGSLGMYCVAEGVETEQQLAFFNRRGCYLIQGFLFAKPMPAEALLTFLQHEHDNL
ncbi:EAL domain-containing protein [Rheinheimera baltica]|uniref:EAL domain-containing protein n=1 Tax=Rheinheimera baltica TaxID=67576 RepID=UPI00273DA839|nr:EAL domain-containing protein [Rheinheimera baltica]MDP5141816.1 EAL domain-containing protein [Rheinheimera baltica]